MKNYNYKPIYLTALILISSCAKEDDVQYITETRTETVTVEVPTTVTQTVIQTVTVEIPYSYEYARNGKSTVSYSGQTSRLKMADELYAALNTNTFTKAQLLEMFNEGTGFSDASLNSSGKQVGSKTAAGCSHGPLATTKARYTSMLEDFADNVVPAWTATAANGQAGLLTDSARSINVNANGWEVDQTFIKGIIGGMCVDQIVNNYLDACQFYKNN